MNNFYATIEMLCRSIIFSVQYVSMDEEIGVRIRKLYETLKEHYEGIPNPPDLGVNVGDGMKMIDKFGK